MQAGPGTGKTGTLIGRVLFLVRERGVAPQGILVLTFSNRAVGEVRERLASALGNVATAITVCTFHAFARELLRRYSEGRIYEATVRCWIPPPRWCCCADALPNSA